MMPNPEPEKASDEAQPQSNSIQNGVEPIVRDRDEIMTEVEEAEMDDMTIDMDAFQEMLDHQKQIPQQLRILNF